MARPDPGPLLEEHLDELELICRAGENDGQFDPGAAERLGVTEDFDALEYVLGWIDRHSRKLLEASRWALASGWQRGAPLPVSASGKYERLLSEELPRKTKHTRVYDPDCKWCHGTGSYVTTGDAHRSAGVVPCRCWPLPQGS